MFDNSEERNKIILYKNTDYIFVSFAVILNILTGTLQILENVVVETFLINRICDNFSSVIQEFWDFIIGDFRQNGLKIK